MLSTCATCGELTEHSYCEEHTPKVKDTRSKRRQEQGYDYKWVKLSQRARRLQPFCLDCGTTEDLTADHTPEAWKRKEAGKPIRLQDIEVVCRSCNSKRGAARGDRSRSNALDPQTNINTNGITSILAQAKTDPGGLPLKECDQTPWEAEGDVIISESSKGGAYGWPES